MAIPNYMIFGVVKNSSGSPINGTMVYAVNTSQGNISITTVTDSNGTYKFDLSTLSTVFDGDSIVISTTYNHESMQSYFDIDLTSPFKRIDLTLSWTDYKKDFGTDVLIEKLNLYNKYNIDTLLMAINESDYDIDTLLLKTEDTPFIYDILAKLMNLSTDYLISVLVSFVIKNHIDVDLLAKKLGIYEKYHNDILLLKKSLKIEEKFDIIVKLIISTDINITSLIEYIGMENEYLIDILLKNTLESKYNVDLFLVSRYLENPNIFDILLKKSLSYNLHEDILLLKHDVELDAGYNVRVGENLVVWSIDNCSDWDLGTYVNNTMCDNGELTLEDY